MALWCVGVKPGECHYQRGTQVAYCKMNLLGTIMDQVQVSHENIRFVQIGTQERGRIRHEIDDMLELLSAQKEAIL